MAGEQLLTPAQVAALIPRRRGHGPTPVGTVYRWMQKGIRGVRLAYIQVGGTRCTTRADLDRFFARLGSFPGEGGPAAGPYRVEAEAEASPHGLKGWHWLLIGPDRDGSDRVIARFYDRDEAERTRERLSA